MLRIFLPLFLIVLSLATGWYFLHDFSICAVILLTCLLLFAWLFNFPSGKWLYNDELETESKKLGDTTAEHLKESSLKDAKVTDIVHRLPDLEGFVATKIRKHDTTELIEDTQEAIIKTLIPYTFILIGFIFIYFQIKNADPTVIEKMHMYKDFSALIYLGVAFCYIAWNIAPIVIQKKKNKMAAGH